MLQLRSPPEPLRDLKEKENITLCTVQLKFETYCTVIPLFYPDITKDVILNWPFENKMPSEHHIDLKDFYAT